METIIVTNQPQAWAFAQDFVKVIDTATYLTNPQFANNKQLRVINLNASYKYQSQGYYVSLLAEARQHKVLPSITTMQDLKNPAIAKIISLEIDESIQRHLKLIKSKTFMLSVYFGRNVAQRYERLSQQLHKLFPAPLFRVTFQFNKKWQIKNIAPITIADIPKEHYPDLTNFARYYLEKKRFHVAKLAQRPYDLAILVDADDKTPPSNKKAIEKFIKIGEESGFNVDIITKDDFHMISDFDALFIRATTSVNHFTYRFARRAAAEGVVVIDDPESILKCTNKVFLSELLTQHRLPIPETHIINKKAKEMRNGDLPYPCVLKLPDSSSSQGVVKVENAAALQPVLQQFFQESELLLAQAYVPTDFDWRIAILDNQPLFACKYHMAKNHWQIYNWQNSKDKEGDVEAVALEAVPAKIINIALKAAKLIGDSLYGVDIKQQGENACVIEVNDNPTIDAGDEDGLLGDTLYQKIIHSLLERVKRKHGYQS